MNAMKTRPAWSRSRRAALLLAAAGLAAPAAWAQAWPARPIRMIVPFPPGGSTDVVARLFAQKLSEQLQQSVVVDNRPGGSANVGTEAVARAAPDGYTILMGPVLTLSVNHALDRKSMKYDLEKDLVPVAIVASVPVILVVSPSLPIQSVADFAALARSRPGHVSFGSAGNGTPERLTAEMFRLRAGVNMLNVPYKGGPQIVTDVMRGEVHSVFVPLPPAIAQVKAGKLRALAVTTANRVPMVPDVPTMAEAGFPDFEVSTTSAIFAPAGTPRPIVDRLNAELARIAAMQDVKDTLMLQGGFVAYSTPEQAARKVRSEIETWSKVIREANITPE